MPAEARFCGSCGMDTLSAEAPAPTVEQVSPAPAAAGAPASDASTTETAEITKITDGKYCSWCGAQSPQEAARCVSCGATFPTPEGNEALERAAQARIQSMESELRQPKRGGWWPFRSR